MNGSTMGSKPISVGSNPTVLAIILRKEKILSENIKIALLKISKEILDYHYKSEKEKN